MPDLSYDEAVQRLTISIDRWEESTFVCALINYALQVAHPDECVRCLNIVSPNPKRPWIEIIKEARSKVRGIYDEAEEVAAQRER